MGTTKSRKSRRNNSRPAAYTFLSNITLGNENEQNHKQSNSAGDKDVYYTLPTAHESVAENAAGSLVSTDSNLSYMDNHNEAQTAVRTDAQERAFASMAAAPSLMTTGNGVPPSSQPRRRWSVESDDQVQHHKLTREDSERPIASEKIKKKSHHADKESMSFMSVVRYYTEKIRQTAGKKKTDEAVNRGYVHQQLTSHDNNKRRPAQSYAQFLVPSYSLMHDDMPPDTNGYDPYFLDNDSYSKFNLLSSSQGTSSGQTMRPSEVKRELNEQFRLAHPEIMPEITLSKIRSIKNHLVEIGKAVDLEISSVAHAFVYFEKLVIKNVVTKRNRKLIAACCLFLATKVNEPRGTWFEPLFDAIDDELDVDSKEIREHEFAVFADLEFNLYIPNREFMPHFERIFQHLEYKTIEEYLGTSDFYKN